MKKPSADLHLLIHSLSVEEKRHFVLSAGTFRKSEAPQYLELFQLIAAQPDYDEERIRRHFGERMNDNQFSVAKNYLYNALLKVLSGLQAGMSASRMIRDALLHLEVLYVRELYPLARKQLKKVERMMEAVDNPLLGLELVEWKQRLLRVEYYQHTSSEEISHLTQHIHHLQNQVNHYLDLYALSTDFMYHFTHEGFVRTSEGFRRKTTEIMELLPFQHPERADSLPAKTLYLNTWGIYLYALGRYPESYQYYRELFLLMEANQGLFFDHPQFYLGVLFNFGAICMALQNFAEVRMVIARLEGIKKGGHRIQARTFYYTSILKTRTIIDSLELEHSAQYIGNSEAELKRHNQGLNRVEYYSACFNLGLLAFFTGDFRKSLRLINEILNDASLHQFPDIHLVARLIRLIIHIELENYDLVETLGGNIYRSLLKGASHFRLEKLILKFFRRVPDMRNPLERIPFLTDLRKDLNEFLDDPAEGRFFQYFDFDTWLESQITEQRMAEVMRRRKGE